MTGTTVYGHMYVGYVIMRIGGGMHTCKCMHACMHALVCMMYVHDYII